MKANQGAFFNVYDIDPPLSLNFDFETERFFFARAKIEANSIFISFYFKGFRKLLLLAASVCHYKGRS